MKRLVILSLSVMFIFTSCGAKKDLKALQVKHKKTLNTLNSTTVKLNSCMEEKAAASAKAQVLQEQVGNLVKSNESLTQLTAKSAENIEKTLESLDEKQLKINRLQDALTRKDSVALALVTSLKKEVGLDDPDIEINVEKGVVFISISDKLLFNSGSYEVSSNARKVLAKVAKVINGKPNFECMIEGHTDDVPYNGGPILDNWDLSVKRSTSIIRVLEKLGVDSKQLIAAGRSHYAPLVENNSAENKAINRRTRVVILPKIDQFYDMIEKEMKTLSESEE